MLEAKTGKPVWETLIADYADGYFVSQAPLVVKGSPTRPRTQSNPSCRVVADGTRSASHSEASTED
jgi:hypothetical protein